MTLTEKIRQECSVKGLSYNGNEPQKVTPGVFLFYATPLSDDCKKHGHCVQNSYKCVIINEKIVIQ